MKEGSAAIARAMPTRCCWPPLRLPWEDIQPVLVQLNSPGKLQDPVVASLLVVSAQQQRLLYDRSNLSYGG